MAYPPHNETLQIANNWNESRARPGDKVAAIVKLKSQY